MELHFFFGIGTHVRLDCRRSRVRRPAGTLLQKWTNLYEIAANWWWWSPIWKILSPIDRSHVAQSISERIFEIGDIRRQFWKNVSIWWKMMIFVIATFRLHFSESICMWKIRKPNFLEIAAVTSNLKISFTNGQEKIRGVDWWKNFWNRRSPSPIFVKMRKNTATGPAGRP